MCPNNQQFIHPSGSLQSVNFASGGNNATSQLLPSGFTRVPPSHELVDAKQTNGEWHEAWVVQTCDRAWYVHYKYFLSAYDEWISVDSGRLAPHGKYTYLGRDNNLRPGQRLDFYDDDAATQAWTEAVVQDVHGGVAQLLLSRKSGDVTMHCPVSDVRIAKFGEFTRGTQPFREKVEQYWNQHPRTPSVARGHPRFDEYQESLRRYGLNIHLMSGDGNCLFRSAAHQLYGQDELHGFIRSSVCDYMMIERDYFSNWVEGDFNEYITRKRKLGEWGDDPEIQALSELYDAAIEIWAYDPDEGAKPLRTFHESTGNDTQLRLKLSYYGGGHYDSLVGSDFKDKLLTNPGLLERHRLQIARNERAARSRRADHTSSATSIALLSSDVNETERQVLHNTLEASRELYESHHRCTDAQLKARVPSGLDNTPGTLEAQILRHQLDETEREAVDESLLDAAVAESAQNAQHFSEDSSHLDSRAGDIEDQILQQALQESLQDQTSQNAIVNENEFNDTALQAALQASLEQRSRG